MSNSERPPLDLHRVTMAGLPMGPAVGQQPAEGGPEFACARLWSQCVLRRACEPRFGLVSAVCAAGFWFPFWFPPGFWWFPLWFPLWFPRGFRWFPLVSAVVSAFGFGFRLVSAYFRWFPLWFPPLGLVSAWFPLALCGFRPGTSIGAFGFRLPLALRELTAPVPTYHQSPERCGMSCIPEGRAAGREIAKPHRLHGWHPPQRSRARMG